MISDEGGRIDGAAADGTPGLAGLAASGRIGITARRSRTPRPVSGRRPLGRILLDHGAITPGDLTTALALREREDVRLGDILLTHGWVSEAALMAALAEQWQAALVDLAAEPPDPRLIDALGPELCLKEAMVPWRRIGATTVIATARPEEFTRLRGALPVEFAPYRMVLAPERAVHDALLSRRQTALIRRAECRVAAAESCRSHDGERASRLALGMMAGMALGLLLAPVAVFALLFGWAVATLVLSMALKLLAWLAELQRLATTLPPARVTAPIRLPVISVMVPLFREHDIAERLVRRLGRLTYPRELLDVLLVVEEEDSTTRDALAGATLPRGLRVVTVPDGPIRTKPRALNFALNFCRGSIVGVWDAEDMPDPDQLHAVARRFAEAPPEVACLQGVLDYYNPRTNWLARCFTVEYAVWFRAVLPGVARLGLAVPLGGTTLFFRRDLLEAVGAWDAFNVTEDADLGIRLARRGLRTELLATVTREEANCRPLPWVKQRSRWLKGYAMTWGVHMRAPGQLWRELGAWRFLGLQVMFLGALSQYLLAPLLWSCWLIFLGVWHPVRDLLSAGSETALLSVFALAEIVNLAVGIWAVRGPRHRHLLPWVPTLHFYFPLGALAGWKAIYEVVTRPFYWDKTAHGLFDALHGVAAPATPAPALAPAPVEPARPSRAPQID